MKLTGLDIGTTSICGIVTDSLTGGVLKTVTRANDSFINIGKKFERIQDPERILDIVTGILTELNDGEISAIGISGQMHGILYYDGEGRAVSPLYTWQDERASLEFEDGVTYAGAVKSYPGYGLATHFYNKENGLVPENAAGLCTIGDYVAMRLCGCAKAVMHITNAASLGCFDIERNVFDIQDPLLPEITKEFVFAGEHKGIPVSVGIGDNQASFIGSVRDENCLLINIGTGAQISFLTDKPLIDKTIETRPFDGKKYLAAGCSLCGGRAFSLTEKLFTEIARLSGSDISSMYGKIDEILSGKTDTTLVADCRFCGTRAEPSVRGGISNIDENNFTAADIALAVCKGMVDELFDMLPGDAVFSQIIGSGNGIVKNPTVRRLLNSKFRQNILIPVCTEQASYGAAITAGVAGGYFESVEQAEKLIKYKEIQGGGKLL